MPAKPGNPAASRNRKGKPSRAPARTRQQPEPASPVDNSEIDPLADMLAELEEFAELDAGLSPDPEALYLTKHNAPTDGEGGTIGGMGTPVIHDGSEESLNPESIESFSTQGLEIGDRGCGGKGKEPLRSPEPDRQDGQPDDGQPSHVHAGEADNPTGNVIGQDAGEEFAIDWEAVKREYRANVISVEAIGRAYCPAGLSVRAFTARVRRRAQTEGWRRDLSRAVRDAAKDELLFGELDTDPASDGRENDHARDDDAIVRAAAAVQVEVQRQHRRDLKEAREITAKLLAKCGWLIDRRKSIPDFETLHKAMQSMESYIRSLHRTIVLERQAFSLDSNERTETDASAVESRVMKHHRGDDAGDAKAKRKPKDTRAQVAPSSLEERARQAMAA